MLVFGSNTSYLEKYNDNNNNVEDRNLNKNRREIKP